MAIIPMAMIIFQPFWARVSDKLGTRQTLLLTLSGTLLSTIGLIFARSFLGFFIVLSLYACFTIAIVSLIDRIILASHSKQYGRIRLWGSIGYGISIFLSGLFKSYILGFWSFIIHILILFITLLIAKKIPSNQTTRAIDPIKRKNDKNNDKKSDKKNDKMGSFYYKNKKFIVMMFSSLIAGMAMKGNECFFPVGLINLHISDFWMGSSWIFGIISEIIVFYFLDKYSRKMSSWWNMIIGVFMYSVRMGILSCFPILWVWIASQPIYNIGFCFWYYGVVGTINTLFKDEEKSRGYAAFWAITHGVGGVLGSLFSGYIVKGLGVYSLFGILAVICFLAAVAQCLFSKQE